MITVTVYKESGVYRGFVCEGHAGYAEEGSDIICAAVSALTVNAANSIERFTEDPVEASSQDGILRVSLTGSVSRETALLLDSMLSGLQEIQNSYGSKYIRFLFKEV